MPVAEENNRNINYHIPMQKRISRRQNLKDVLHSQDLSLDDARTVLVQIQVWLM
jgi:hypothetical protein